MRAKKLHGITAVPSALLALSLIGPAASVAARVPTEIGLGQSAASPEARRQEPQKPIGRVRVAVDFNKDGRRDLLSDHYRPGPQGLGRVTEIQALDGRTGRTIFTREFNGSAMSRGAFVGPSGAPGALVFTDGSSSARAEGTVTALDASAEVVWERAIAGFSAGVSNAWVYQDDFSRPNQDGFRGVSGVATDALVVLHNGGPLSPRTNTLVALDGRDGSTAWDWDWSGDDYFRLSDVPDLDGDGLRELMWSSLTDFVVLDGDSGRVVWESSVGYLMSPIGDICGRGTTQFLAFESDPYRVNLIDGRTGRVLWKRNGVEGYVIGDVDHDGRHDIGLQQAGRRTVTYSVVNCGAQELRSHAFVIRPPEGQKEKYAGHWPLPGSIGDLDGDGFVDARHSLFSELESGQRVWHRGYVSGRNGRFMWKGKSFTSLRMSVDGDPGIDLYDAERSRETLTLEVRDGATGNPFWTTMFQLADSSTRARIHPLADVHNGRILVNLLTRTGATSVVGAAYLLDGRTGKAIWSRT